MTTRNKVFLVLATAIVGGILAYSLIALKSGWLAGDEAVFIRITERLPAYSSRAEWWTRDGITDPDKCDYLLPSDFYHKVLDTPIWRHPPLANYLAYPAVKLLMNEESVATIDQSTVKLRHVAWIMLGFCVTGVVQVVRRRDRTGDTMLAAALPLAAGYAIFTFNDTNWFYHDIFALVFLVTALLIRKTKYEKFIYIPLAAMVACKITAVLLLIPFVIENRKAALCGLALVPYLMQTYLVTGNPLWIAEHWLMVTTAPDSVPSASSEVMQQHLLGIIKEARSLVPFFAVTAVPFVYTVYNAVRKRGGWFYPVLFAVAIVPTIMWAVRYWEMLPLYYYQMLPMLLAGMLIAGEAAMQFKARKYLRQMEVIQKGGNA